MFGDRSQADHWLFVRHNPPLSHEFRILNRFKAGAFLLKTTKSGTTGNPFVGKPNCKKFGGSATLQKMFNYFEAEQVK